MLESTGDRMQLPKGIRREAQKILSDYMLEINPQEFLKSVDEDCVGAILYLACR